MKTLRTPGFILMCMLTILAGGVLMQSFSNPELVEAAKGGQPKVDICHYDADTDTYHQIRIAVSAKAAHLAHGDDPDFGEGCTAGVGECTEEGTMVCTESGAVCNAVPGEPSPEVCDGKDNDCDASTDEELGQTSCGLGVCQRTVDNCVSGEAQECIPGTAGEETCNGLDDDCDGTIDDVPGLGGACSAGVGACKRDGVLLCGPEGLSCDAVPGEPSPEVCDNLDNDCNGATDDHIPSVPTSCGTGACAAEGGTSCIDGVFVDSCTPGPSSPEVCDGIDNDCDGVTDEGC